MNENTFFDKLKKSLRSQQVYENFLKCLALYNQDIVTRSELISLVEPFLSKLPNLYRWFKDYVENRPLSSVATESTEADLSKDKIHIPPGENICLDIDYLSCKQYGASYRDISSYPQPISSGQTDLCKQVLNATYVSFPSWSEDSTFISSKKNQYEELIFRIEDERFELDVVLESNLSTIRILESLQTKLGQMTPDELSKFRLNNSLGGNSEIIHIKAIQRIYGDKAKEFIDGLKRNPSVAVPLVLKRLRAKDEEWREAKKNLEKQWREQIERNYLKSLDHCAGPFKQNDPKHLKTKSLINEIESVYYERQEAKEHESPPSGDAAKNAQPSIQHSQPHLSFKYEDKSIVEDAAALIIHHVKRQTMQKEDKQRIKQIVYHFLSDLFFISRGALSDDESYEPPALPAPPPPPATNDKSAETKSDENGAAESSAQKKLRSNTPSARHTDANKRRLTDADLDKSNDNVLLPTEYKSAEDLYRLFYVDEHWYLFFRYHQILCERLHKIYRHAQQIAEQEMLESRNRELPVAEALKLRSKSDVRIDEYYPTFLDIVRNLLDGNADSTQYEDTLREMFGIHAYIAFTLDKVVHNCVRQLQYLVQDETSTSVKQTYCDEIKSSGSGLNNVAGMSLGSLLSSIAGTAAGNGVSGCGGKVSHMCYASVMSAELAYQKRVESMLSDQNCYKIISYKNSSRLTMELIDTQSDEDDDENDVEVEKWAEYVDRYASEEGKELGEEMREALTRRPVFLTRNAHHLKCRFGKAGKPAAQPSHEAKTDNADKAVGERREESDSRPIENEAEMKIEETATAGKQEAVCYKIKHTSNDTTLMYRRNALRNAKKVS
jgi:paired amphipathic helix protein Sin3a